MLPLDKGDISMAAKLKTEIDTNASPSTTAFTVEEWNAIGQNYLTYAFPTGDISIHSGQPYRVTVDISTGSTST